MIDQMLLENERKYRCDITVGLVLVAVTFTLLFLTDLSYVYTHYALNKA